MKRSEQNKIAQRFIDCLGLKFSNDPASDDNKESWQKMMDYVQSKRGAK